MTDETTTVIISETITVIDVEPPRPHGPIRAHYCEHPGCQKWGGLGFARYRSDAPRWFCGEHRDDGERILNSAWQR